MEVDLELVQETLVQQTLVVAVVEELLRLVVEVVMVVKES
jgi:hypothetical protein